MYKHTYIHIKQDRKKPSLLATLYYVLCASYIMEAFENKFYDYLIDVQEL